MTVDWALGAGWALAGRAGRGRSAQVGRWACRRGAGRTGGRRAGGRARGRRAGRAAWALGARPGRWAHGLGARAGQECALGAPDLIFKPIFRLGIFLESVNEHCSLKNKFFEKKNIY